MADMRQFKNDDHGYLAWLVANPMGYVLNVRHDPDPGYVVLHRASCGTIGSPKQKTGAFTERSFRKWVANSKVALKAAARNEGRSDGSFSNRCGLCNP